MAIYNQTSLEKTRVPIDLKGEKSQFLQIAQNTPHTSPCAPKGKSLYLLASPV